MPSSVQLRCTTCKYQAKRTLVEEVGSRGVHETPCEKALCLKGHGPLVRIDGGRTVE